MTARSRIPQRSMRGDWRIEFDENGQASRMHWIPPREGPPHPEHPAPCLEHAQLVIGCEACYLSVKGWPRGDPEAW